MKRIFVIFLSVLLFTNACSTKDLDLSTLKARGGAKYGGEFRFMSPEKISNLFPLSTNEIYNQRVFAQIFESPLKINLKNNEVSPNLIERVETDKSAKKFTLHVRKGVKFHDDNCFNGGKGKELTAEDIKFTLDFACSGLKINEMSWILNDKIVGAQKYYEQTKSTLKEGGVLGIKVIGKYKLSIELTESFIGFDKVLTYPGLGVFPKEAYDTYKNEIKNHPVGTGPFLLSEWDEKHILLKRNNSYWKKDEFGNQLPFLEKISLTYATNKKSELMAFRNRSIDLVMEIPVDEIENILGTLEEAQAGKTVKHKVDAKSSFSTTYIGFAHTIAPFNDIRVRKALNIAIDRTYLVNNYLKGEGYPVENGFIPEMIGFTNTKVIGHKFDIQYAQNLLAEAGFPNGQNFPVTDLYLNAKKGDPMYLLALGVKEQLKKNLNVNINLKLCSINERDRAALTGEAKMWKAGWIGDYPEPENFLNLFSSEHIGSNSTVMNLFKYNSKEFDRTLALSKKEKNAKVRNDLYVKCDQLIIDDAVVMPLIYHDFITMINSKIKNFQTNSMEMLDLSDIYIKEPKK